MFRELLRKLYFVKSLFVFSDERHARLQKKARPHEDNEDDNQDEEEDLNDANYDEVRREYSQYYSSCMSLSSSQVMVVVSFHLDLMKLMTLKLTTYTILLI